MDFDDGFWDETWDETLDETLDELLMSKHCFDDLMFIFKNMHLPIHIAYKLECPFLSLDHLACRLVFEPQASCWQVSWDLGGVGASRLLSSLGAKAVAGDSNPNWNSRRPQPTTEEIELSNSGLKSFDTLWFYQNAIEIYVSATNLCTLNSVERVLTSFFEYVSNAFFFAHIKVSKYQKEPTTCSWTALQQNDS